MRKTADAEALLKKAGQSGRNLVPLILDVTNPEQIADSVKVVTQRLQEAKSALLAVVNNAGYSETGPVELMPIDKFRKQLDGLSSNEDAATCADRALMVCPLSSGSERGGSGGRDAGFPAPSAPEARGCRLRPVPVRACNLATSSHCRLSVLNRPRCLSLQPRGEHLVWRRRGHVRRFFLLLRQQARSRGVFSHS